MNEERVLALDLGGTKLLIGEVDRKGRILKSRRYPSGYRTQEEELDLIEESLKNYIKEEAVNYKEIYGAGIGLIGQVDARRGIWNMIDSKRKTEIPVVKRLAGQFPFPFFIENDVKAAARAERIWGAGREAEDFIYLNIGTGIAAGIVAGGRLVRGKGNDAGEVGHTCVGICGEISCSCGQRGCVESIASGGGMDRRIKILADEYPKSPLTKASKKGFVEAERIFSAARGKDPLAVRIAGDAAEALASLLINLTRFSDPSRIVLGGGIGGDLWMRGLIQDILREKDPEKRVPEVISSWLRPDTAGLIGAAAVAMGLE